MTEQTEPFIDPVTDPFIGRVLEQTGHTDAATVRRIAEHTLRALGRALETTGPDLNEVLDPSWIDVVEQGRHATPRVPEELYATAAAAARVRPAVSLEIAQGVLAEVSRRLTPAARNEMRAALPDDWAELIVEPRPRSTHRPPSTAGVTPGRGRTLSTGRPGPTHPLHEAGPDAGHSKSLAASEDPHADTKLASSRGPSQERTGNTLAQGRPGSKHPVSSED